MFHVGGGELELSNT